MPAIIGAGPLTGSLARALKADFIGTYRDRLGKVHPSFADVMKLGVASDKLEEVFGYFKAPPHPARRPRGQSPKAAGFDAVRWAVRNYDYALRIAWHKNDEADEQSHSLRTQAQSGGKNYAILPERIAYQIILAATDANLLPAVPSAPDGVALYSATDGDGNNRFGVSGGNIVTGSGTGSAMPPTISIQNDVYNALERLGQFQDGQGQPLFTEDVIKSGVLLIYGMAFHQEMLRAFKQATNIQLTTNAGAPSGTIVGAAAPSNVVIDSGQIFELLPTQRITTNDIYLFVKGADFPPLFQLVRSPLKEVVADETNSDHSRATGECSVQWESREGYGVALPYATIMIDNA